MAKRNRLTLKNYFKKGNLPKEEHFSDFIDSVLNIIDDGLSKSIDEGLKIAPIGNSEKLLSFFRNIEDKCPLWSFDLDKKKGALSLKNEDGNSILTFTKKNKIGVNKDNPNYDLDINGIVASKGRAGGYKTGTVPADGKWYEILYNLDGCNAFEIVAGVGKKKSGQYALIHAIAVSTFNSRNKINTTQGYYRTMCNKIKLKWSGSKNNYSLNIKTKQSYDKGVHVSYQITKLWFDEYMENCLSTEDKK